MTHYSYAQLEGLWINAGGSRSLAPLMAAIAEAESGGNSTAMNYTDNGGTQTSVGLWQLSTGTHSYPQSWTTPSGNAAGAVAKYRSQGLGAWGTYTSGAYKAFLSSKTSPAGVSTTGSYRTPGSSGGGGMSAGAPIQTYSAKNCIWTFPGVQVPVIGNVGEFCILSKSMVRSWIGAGLMFVGLNIAGGGLAVIALDAGLHLVGPLVGLATRTQAVGNTAARATGLKAQRQREAAAARTAQQQQAAQERAAQRAEREAARNAPARGRHARPAERRRGTGGRHRRPETA